MTTEINKIWEGDLLNRKEEAMLLSQYIESIVDYTHIREDAQAFTIAVDAGYGEGKTWFLKRLAKQLELNHPVAFVDAWHDDLADEPLTALAATLKKAILPLAKKHPEIQSKFDTVIKKAGSVAKIAGKGLIKRGLGLLITKEAVDAAEQVFDGASEAVLEAINDGVKDGGQEFVDNVADAIERVPPDKLMEQRIADFEAGQGAIEDLKASLTALVKALDRNDTHPPIVIIIDELDRCRPTYAIKLLEEVKHLFDVPGLVFVFGLHSGQLAHSVNAAYGAGFDGRAYIARFIHRHYRLAKPSLGPFVGHLLQRAAVPKDRLWFPQAYLNTSTNSHMRKHDIIAFHLTAYGLSARDGITVIETLQTCCAVTKNAELLMPLLLPMIIAKIKGEARGKILEINIDYENKMTYILNDFQTEKNSKTHWQIMLIRLHELTMLESREIMEKSNTDDTYASYLSMFMSNTRSDPLANPLKYSDLLEAVGRFGNPTPQQDGN